MRSLGACLHLALLALVVMLVAAASDRAHYFCRMMDRSMAEPCCAPEPNTDGPAADALDCCERIIASTNSIVAAAHDATPELKVALAAIAPTPLEYPAPTFRLLVTTPAAARAPPAIGPPLFLAHCSWLI